MVNMDLAVSIISDIVAARQGGFISLVGAHPAVEARLNEKYAKLISKARLILPDGMSVVWAARVFGYKIKGRVYGPDLMVRLLAISENKGYSNFFYGGTEETLIKLVKNMKNRFPRLNVAGVLSPPFRKLSKDEETVILKQIKESKPDILWVGLGAPKQDMWMGSHEEGLPGITQIGVGAAFDFHAGQVRQAPYWIQRCGLEWLFRITQEPGRLWLRYAKCVPLFIYFVLLQYIRGESNAKK